jgi:hypothetical protein
VLRQSLILILEEDAKKKEEIELHRQPKKEIADFTKPEKLPEQISLVSIG